MEKLLQLLHAQVLKSEGELTDSEGDGGGNGTLFNTVKRGSRGSLIRPRSQNGPISVGGASADSDR